MELPVTKQLTEMALSILVGLGAGILYDIMRTFRRRLPLPGITAFLDILFWFSCTCAVFILGLTTGGKQRLFMWVFAILGYILYHFVFSTLFQRIFNLTADLISLLVTVFAFPFVYTAKTIKKIKFFSKNIFQYAEKWYKIKCTPKKARHTPALRKENTNEIQTIGYTHKDHFSDPDHIRGGVPRNSVRKNIKGKNRPAGHRAGNKRYDRR